MRNSKVVIEVSGGVITQIHSSNKRTVAVVIDHDVLKERKGFNSKEITKIIKGQTKGLKLPLVMVDYLFFARHN